MDKCIQKQQEAGCTERRLAPLKHDIIDLTTLQDLSILGTYHTGISTHSHHSEPSSASLGSTRRCRSFQKKMGYRWDYPCFEEGHLAR